MLRWIMRQIRQEEEITITMIQFQLGSRIIIAIKTQLRHEEALQITLALYGIPNG